MNIFFNFFYLFLKTYIRIYKSIFYINEDHVFLSLSLRTGFAFYGDKIKTPTPIFIFLQIEKINESGDVLMRQLRVSRRDYTALISRRRPQFNLQFNPTISGRISARSTGPACGPRA